MAEIIVVKVRLLFLPFFLYFNQVNAIDNVIPKSDDMDTPYDSKKQISRSIIMAFLALTFVTLAAGKLHAQIGHYTPPALVMPMHSQKGQLHASLGIGRGLDMNLSYAFSNHLVVFATGGLNNGRSRRSSLFGDLIYYEKDDQALTGGFGYFWKPDGNSPKKFETYIGAGKFYADSHRYFAESGSLRSRIKTDYWNLFWQFSSGRKVKNSEMACAVRLSYSNYNDLYFETQGGMYKPNVTKDLWGMNIDPVANYSYLWRNFKLNGQIGLSLPLFKVAAEETRTEYFVGEEIVTTEIVKQNLGGAGLARLSVQYTFGSGLKTDTQKQ